MSITRLRTVIVIGARADPHVKRLADAVRRRGYSALWLDPSGLMDTVSISFGRLSASRREKNRDKYHKAMETAVGVWFRAKPAVPAPSWGPLQSSGIEFAHAEWRTLFHTLPALTPHARWVNHPANQREIASKPNQLRLATSVGLLVPETRITNDPSEVAALFRHSRRVVYKSLNWFSFPDQTGILTTEIHESDLSRRARSIRRAPGIYQEFVEKAHELRITIVGSQVFPARVRTPSKGKASIDWRHASFEDIFERCEIDRDLSERLLAFHSRAGLVYGAYDLIVRPDGSPVFLECNPAGQFLWLEYSLGLPIMDAVVNELCREPSEQRVKSA